MHEKTKIEKMLREKAEAISSEYNGAPVVIIVGGTGEIKMRKSFSIFFTLLFVSIGLTSSCYSYKNKKVNLYHGMQPASKFIKVIKCTPDEVTFRIQIQFAQKKLNHIIEQKKLYHIIEDEEKNFISEGWFPITLGAEVFYILKMKAKKGLFFESGKEYALCIGLENPEQTIRYSANYRCKIYHKFTMQIQPSTRLRPAPPPPAPSM